MTDTRRKNVDWNLPDGCTRIECAQLAVLMDIRDELQEIRRLAGCYRIPRALDAIHELGVEARRRKLTAAKKRATAKRNAK